MSLIMINNTVFTVAQDALPLVLGKANEMLRACQSTPVASVETPTHNAVLRRLPSGEVGLLKLKLR